MTSFPDKLSPEPKPASYLLLSFFLPLLIILIALAGLQISPFGDHTLLISDAKAYYINTLSYAGRMFRGLEGFTYSFEKGMGGNMMGHLNGILLTPFAFLLSFVGIENYPVAFTFISILNLSLGGLTMYIFLADCYGHRRSNLIFSTSYALMGFNVANVFQAVFFCAAPVLPIMALGLKRIFQGKSPLLYILSIAYGLLTNAYFGYVLCAASVLFFLAGLYLYRDELRDKTTRIVLRYAISSLCGGLLVAVLWLPGFLSLRGGRLEKDSLSALSLWENMPFLEIGAKLFTGANSTDELVNGLPNIFVGIIPLALSVFFFINREIDRKKKLAIGTLLGIYLLAFYTSAVNLLMHAGTTTNWFNYRYSYVFSFLLLVASAQSWQQFDGVTSQEIKRGLIGMLIATVLVFSKKYAFVKGGWVLLDYVLLLLAGLALFMHRKDSERNPRKTLEQILLFLVCMNLFLNYRVCTKNIQDWEITESDFQATVQAVDPLVDGLNKGEPGFFRMEVNEQLSGTCGNDPMLYGYNGVGHGGSNERDFVRTGLSKLGIPWFDMRNYYADGVPAATDALLGIKYVVAEKDLTAEKGYRNLTNFGSSPIFSTGKNCELYYNEDALSMALLSGTDIFTVETEAADVFDNLNRVWAAITGEDSPVFLEESEIVFTPHSFFDPSSLRADEARAIVERYDSMASASSESSEASPQPVAEDTNEPPQFSSYIEYSFTATRSGPVYVYNRAALSDVNGSATPTVNCLGYHEAGDKVTGYLTVQTLDQVVMEEYCGRLRVAYADTDALHMLSEIVKARPVTLEVPGDDHLTGNFTADRNEALLFTIPYDEGWTCTVDGQQVELKQVLGVFMAAQVEAGEHSFEMTYIPAGLHTGMMISACALTFTLLYIVFGRKRWGNTLIQKSDGGNCEEGGGVSTEEIPVCSKTRNYDNVSGRTSGNSAANSDVIATRSKRLAGLDFIKIVATLFIVLHHYQQNQRVYFEHGINFYYGKFYFGWLVELFFVISGFVFFPYIEKIKNGLDFRKYFSGRYFRFQPLMAISVAVYSGLMYLFKLLYLMPWDGNNNGALDFILSAVGLHALWNKVLINNPLWYISVLLVCYAIMYGIVRLAKRLSVPTWIGFVLMILLGVFVFSSGINVFLLNSRTARGLYAFFWGLLLAGMVKWRKPQRTVYIIAVAILLVSPLLYIFAFEYINPQINYLLTFVFYTAVILVFTSEATTKLFQGRVWQIVSDISYHAYVWHSAVFILAAVCFYLVGAVPDFSNILTVVCMVASIYAFSALSCFIDKQFQQWMKNLGKN